MKTSDIVFWTAVVVLVFVVLSATFGLFLYGAFGFAPYHDAEALVCGAAILFVLAVLVMAGSGGSPT